MPSLYELTNNYKQMENYANDILDTEEGNEEEILEMLIDTLDSIDDSIEVKMENIIKFIKSVESDEVAYKTEKDRLAKKEKSAKNTVERLKRYMFDSMVLLKKDKIETKLFKLRLQSNPASLNIVDESKVPAAFRTPQPDKIDSKAIMAKFKENKDNKDFKIEGVVLVDDKKHLRYS